MTPALLTSAVAAALLGMAGGLRRGSRRSAGASGPIRVVQGGSMSAGGYDSRTFEAFRGFAPGKVKFITAADEAPEWNAERFYPTWLERFGIPGAEWIPVYDENCAERTRDPEFIRMVEEADAIYIGGGQSGRVTSCLFGNYSQSGIDGGEATPMLRAIQATAVVGGSSAGGMMQPSSEILITGHSVESYAAVREGHVFQRDSGNDLLTHAQAVDSHFSERGRQGRLLVFAMQTQAEYAFGVDESTAYHWSPSGVYEVVGANGVVVFQNAEGTSESQSARMHFLTEGDMINIFTGAITYSADKSVCATGAAPAGSNVIFDTKYNGTGVSVYRNISIAASQAPVGTQVSNYHGEPAVEVSFTKTESTVAMCGPSGASFENLFVEQFQSSRTFFVNTEKPNVDLDFIFSNDEA